MIESNFEYIYKGAYGYQLRATIQTYNETTQLWEAADISGFTTREFKIEKPDGVSVVVPADFETGGIDGVIIYILPADSTLFNQVGWYQMQAILSNASQYFPTSKVGFTVDDPL
jgi:hypothetical protein